MAGVLGLSVRLWSSSGSCCLVFDTATDSVVATLLAVLEHHDGVGQPPPQLLQVRYIIKLNVNLYLQRAKKIALGNADPFRKVENSSTVPEAVKEVLDCLISNQRQEHVIEYNSEQITLKTSEPKIANVITNNIAAVSPSIEKMLLTQTS